MHQKNVCSGHDHTPSSASASFIDPRFALTFGGAGGSSAFGCFAPGSDAISRSDASALRGKYCAWQSRHQRYARPDFARLISAAPPHSGHEHVPITSLAIGRTLTVTGWHLPGLIVPSIGPWARFFCPALPYPLPAFVRAPCGPLAQPEGVFCSPSSGQTGFSPPCRGVGGQLGACSAPLAGPIDEWTDERQKRRTYPQKFALLLLLTKSGIAQ